MEKYILSLDQGTTSSRAILFSSSGKMIASAQNEFAQHFPFPGWVEHDPADILASQFDAASQTVEKAGIRPEAVGITNQRETVVVWEKSTGKPVSNAIVWQCRRTAPICEKLLAEGAGDMIKARTGLAVDAYFSGTKIKWILDNIPGAARRAQNGELLCGNVDTWLIYNLTGGRIHATDYTNASRTMLFNINTLEWDKDICALLGIPLCMLPEVRDSAGDFGVIDAGYAGVSPLLDEVPIRGVAGDQQAALFGQTCFDIGDVKNTYGTGCFTLMNVGGEPVRDTGGLISTIGWKIGDETVYALEGSVFNAGSSIKWLRDDLGVINTARECDILAESVPDTGGVHFVSAFTGLGAPYWDMYARGSMTGITRGTTKAHLCRAVLEGIAFQVCDLAEAMCKCCAHPISALRVDGGASVSDFMMQFQADMLGVTVDRPEIVETTAMGAAFLAGLGCGIWKDKKELYFARQTARLYKPSVTSAERASALSAWHEAVRRTVSNI